MSVLSATNRAMKAAQHLDDRDLGAQEALRVLARRLDAHDANARAEARGEDRSVDNTALNVSAGLYFKASEQLGLTPLGRKAIDAAAKARTKDEKPEVSDGDSGRSKVARISSARSARTRRSS